MSYREPYDFYPTPREGTLALLSVEQIDGDIWEPACGDGAIARILAGAGYRYVATDLIDRGYGTGGVDFLRETVPRAKHIITNPPYGSGLADAFVWHALKLAAATGGSVAMLFNLASLAHPRRLPLYWRHSPANVYILAELIFRPGSRMHEPPPAILAAHRYCWVVWKAGHQGTPALAWVSTAPFKPNEQRAW